MTQRGIISPLALAIWEFWRGRWLRKQMSNTVIGFFGVLIPARREWNGFYLRSLPAENTANLIANIRSVSEETKLNTGLHSEVRKGAPGVALHDQEIFGATCASLAHMFEKRNAFGVNALANVLFTLSGQKYFWISKRETDDGGSLTDFHVLGEDIDTLEEAQKALKNLPEVILIDTMRTLEGV